MSRIVLDIFLIVFLSLMLNCCKDTQTMEFSGDFEFLAAAHTGCMEEPPLLKTTPEVQLHWDYESEILNLKIDLSTHCEPEFISSVTFAGNTITIMMEDIADNAARCTCLIREEFRIRVTGTSKTRVICKVRFYGKEEFEQIIDQNLTFN